MLSFRQGTTTTTTANYHYPMTMVYGMANTATDRNSLQFPPLSSYHTPMPPISNNSSNKRPSRFDYQQTQQTATGWRTFPTYLPNNAHPFDFSRCFAVQLVPSFFLRFIVFRGLIAQFSLLQVQKARCITISSNIRWPNVLKGHHQKGLIIIIDRVII